MINIKIKPEERINIECYLLMKELLTIYYRVGRKEPFEINVDDIEPHEVSNFKVFTKPREIHALLENFQESKLVKLESFDHGMWVSFEGEKPPYYRVWLLPEFIDQFKKHEEEIFKLAEDKERKVYRYGEVTLDVEKAALTIKEITKDVAIERREVKFLEKVLQKDGSIATYLELAEFMNLQSFNPLVGNMDMAKDVQDVRKSLDDYLKSVFLDSKIVKILSGQIQNVGRTGYKMKSL